MGRPVGPLHGVLPGIFSCSVRVAASRGKLPYMGWLQKIFKRSRRKKKLSKSVRRYAERWADIVCRVLKDMPHEHVAMRDWATREIEKRGYKFVSRNDLTAHSNRFTMTLRRQIRLVHGWEELGACKQARILVHELFHVLQRRERSHIWWEVRYLSAKWRWTFEASAYLATIMVYSATGKDKKWIELWTERKLKSFYDGYALGRIDWGDYVLRTRNIWAKA